MFQRLDVEKEIIELVHSIPTEIRDLPRRVPKDTPRYHFFLYKHSHEGDYLESVGMSLIPVLWWAASFHPVCVHEVKKQAQGGVELHTQKDTDNRFPKRLGRRCEAMFTLVRQKIALLSTGVRRTGKYWLEEFVWAWKGGSVPLSSRHVKEERGQEIKKNSFDLTWLPVESTVSRFATADLHQY